MNTAFSGIDVAALAAAIAEGVDHGGNRIEPFVDPDGGWPLRCCLQSSVAGERLAIIAWSPARWAGPYREVGPIVVHVDGCPAPWGVRDHLPDPLGGRPMVLRPYSADHRIVYSLVRHLPDGGDLTAAIDTLLAHPDVVEVHGRNWTGGCYAFTATTGT